MFQFLRPNQPRDAETRDELGLTPSHYREIDRDLRRWERGERWKAIRALWGKPKVTRVGPSGVEEHERDRGDDWTFWRAVRCTIGLALNRQWGSRHGDYWRNFDMCYWDAGGTGWGYHVMVCKLFPRCRVEVFDDGEVYL